MGVPLEGNSRWLTNHARPSQDREPPLGCDGPRRPCLPAREVAPDPHRGRKGPVPTRRPDYLRPVPAARHPLVGRPADDDLPVEAATIGNEGAAKLPAALGSQTASQELIGQVEGEMIAVPIETFTKHVQEEDRFRDLVYGYIEALVVQISLTAACNAVHHVNQRCARWLLQTHDRVQGDTLRPDPGVPGGHARRTSSDRLDRATNAEGSRLHHLQQGLHHGPDREGLEAAACRCYETIRTEYSRLVPLRDRR